MTQTVVITISIQLPDGASIAVTPATGTPLPVAGTPSDEPPFPGFETVMDQAAQVFGTRCPVHNLEWKSVPAGVSKSTGKPYDGFRACPERGCKERPR